MTDRLTGQPDTVPAGMATGGRPDRPARQVIRITRIRYASSIAVSVSMAGAIAGAVGRASTVPGIARARIRWLACAFTPRAALAARSVTVAANARRSRMPGPSAGAVVSMKRP